MADQYLELIVSLELLARILHPRRGFGSCSTKEEMKQRGEKKKTLSKCYKRIPPPRRYMPNTHVPRKNVSPRNDPCVYVSLAHAPFTHIFALQDCPLQVYAS